MKKRSKKNIKKTVKKKNTKLMIIKYMDYLVIINQ